MKTRLILWIAWLKRTAKKMLMKQRLDFSFENKSQTMDRLAKMKGEKIVEQRLDFPFKNKIETMESLAKMHGKKIVETTVRFGI